MADINLLGTATCSDAMCHARRTVVFVSASVGYLFYAEASAPYYVYYKKTTNGGSSWGSAVQVSGNHDCRPSFDCWYDQWTPGDSGSIVHVAYLDQTSDDGYYTSLDTSDDSLSTPLMVWSNASAMSFAGYGFSSSITKAVGGNLYVAFINGTTSAGFYRSTDGGGSWGSRSSPWETANDQMALFPGNEADNQDIWCLFQDISADELTLKVYDNSADSWSESASIVTLAENTTADVGPGQFNGSIRHSDGHLIAAVFTGHDTATQDFKVFDINGTGSITALTDITTNIDDMVHPSVFIDNNTDDIYIAYVGKRDGTSVLGTTSYVYYVKSTDGGTTWSSGDTAYSETGGNVDFFYTWTPLGGNRFIVSFREQFPEYLYTNYVNSLDLTPAGGTDVTANPSTLTVTSSQVTASLSGTSLVTNLSLAALASLPSPSLSGTSLWGASPEALTLSVPSYSVYEATIAPAATQTLSAAQASPSLSGTALLASSLAALTLSPVPSSSSGTSLYAPGEIVLTGSLPAPSLSGTAFTASSSPQALTGSFPSPNLSGTALVSPDNNTLTASQPSSSLSGSALYAAGEKSVSLTIPSPSLSGNASLVPGEMVVSVSVPSPSLSGTASFTTSENNLFVSTPSPSLSGNSTYTLSEQALSVIPVPSTVSIAALYESLPVSLVATCFIGSLSGTSLYSPPAFSATLYPVSPEALANSEVTVTVRDLTTTVVSPGIVILQYEGPFVVAATGFFIPGPLEAQLTSESLSFDTFVPGPVEFDYYLPLVSSGFFSPGPEEVQPL